MLRVISIFLITIFGVELATSQSREDWKLKRDRWNIKIYTKKQEDSKLNAYLAETTLDGDVQSALSVLKDINGYHDLFKDIKHLEIVEQNETSHVIYYRFNTPFPAKDRDAYIRSDFEFDSKTQQLQMNMSCVENLPKKGKLIRIDDCHGYWQITEHTPDMISISHFFESDAKGKLPAFIINQFTTKNPMHSLRQFKELIKLPKHQNRNFALIK